MQIRSYSDPQLYRFFVLVISTLMLCTPIGAEEHPIESLATKIVLFEKARDIAGFGDSILKADIGVLAEKQVEVATVTDSRLPFMRRDVDGKKLYRVKMDSVDVCWRDAGCDCDSCLKSFEFVFDLSTEKFLFARTYPPFDGMPPEPGPEHAERYLEQHRQVYSSSPDTPPLVSLAEALQSAASCDPVNAKEIIASYVTIEFMGKPPQPAWVIICRGIDPLYLSEQSRQALGTGPSRRRCVINADTGDWLFTTYGPSVYIDPANRPKGEKSD